MIDQEALKDIGKDLAKRGGSDPSERWIQLNKIEKPIDIRIMDPLPSMEGIYFLEVPTWWIDGTKVYSPKITFKDPTKDDVIDGFINEAELAAKKDKSLANLLSAKNEHGMAKIQFKYEYWIPVMQLNWDDRDVPAIIKKGTVGDYIEDSRVKILVVNLTVLKLINGFLTDRIYKNALDPELGCNFQIQKTGEKRKTKYTVIPRDAVAMPKEYYTEAKMTDPLLIAKALMMDDKYMEAVICKYLYNDVEIPDNKDDYYRFPEIREQLKDKLSDQDNTEENKEVRQRPGRPAPPAPPSPNGTPERGRRAAAEPPVSDLPFDNESPFKEEATAPKRTPGRPGRRNLAQDLKT